jgi:hypothetical protein
MRELTQRDLRFRKGIRIVDDFLARILSNHDRGAFCANFFAQYRLSELFRDGNL